MAHKMNTSLCTNPTKQSCATMCLLYKNSWQLYTSQNSFHEQDGVTNTMSPQLCHKICRCFHTQTLTSFLWKKSHFVATIKPVTFLCHGLHLWSWNERDISNRLNSTSMWVGRKLNLLGIELQTMKHRGLAKSKDILELDWK